MYPASNRLLGARKAFVGSSAHHITQRPQTLTPFAQLLSARWGSTITMDEKTRQLNVPSDPIIPFIEGDGTGPDIWRATRIVLDAAVKEAYKGERQIEWTEVLAGEKSFTQTGEWLPDATLEAFRKHLVGIKGPLTTPVSGGFRSLNVQLRKLLDLYVCLRPVRYFTGVPSPMKRPEDVNMVIFRENTEDIYAGIEFPAGSQDAKDLVQFLEGKGAGDNIRFKETSGLGVKPVSQEGSERLVRAAIQYALEYNLKSVTLAHKGNIMKFTEGAFKEWGYDLARREFRDKVVTERESWILENLDNNPKISVEDNARAIEPGYDMMTDGQKTAITEEVNTVMKDVGATHGNGAWKNKLLIKDTIADITFQQVLTRPKDFSVIATTNLNGDYLSDALAAQVGGIGIAPGGNINSQSGHAIFEATHGTAPKYANLDKVNPGSMILSGEMMLRHLGWDEAADLVVKGMDKTIGQKRVTYDFHRLMDGSPEKLKCSEFGQVIAENMKN